MKIASSDRIPFQNISTGTSSTAYVDKLVVFLEDTLSAFPKERQLKKESSENSLTEDLYIYLTRQARLRDLPFEFQPEKPQKMPKGHDKRVDMAVRVNTFDIDMEIIYCLEAKKLPTDKSGREREKEYVMGEKGGIQRFKNEAHGKDDTGNLLPRNGMVAYITDNDFNHWHNQINSWISSTGWPVTEMLVIEFIKDIGKLKSTHSRMSGVMLELMHFWIKV